VASATTANEDDTRRIVKAALVRVMVKYVGSLELKRFVHSTCQSEGRKRRER
jgi:hypothetical protein